METEVNRLFMDTQWRTWSFFCYSQRQKSKV